MTPEQSTVQTAQLPMTPERNAKGLNFQAKITGFGEDHEAVLLEQIKKGQKDFTITIFKDINDDRTESVLHFSKGIDRYFFNDYKMRFTNRPDDPIASTWERIKINSRFPKNNYTLKESYNLRLGSSVFKNMTYPVMNKSENTAVIDPETGKPKFVEVTRYFKANLNGGLNQYDEFPKKQHDFPQMEENLMRLGIKDLTDPERMINSLNKGNAVPVVLVSGDTQLERWLAIDAEYKTIKVFEKNPHLEALLRAAPKEKKEITNSVNQNDDALVNPSHSRSSDQLSGDVPLKSDDQKVIRPDSNSGEMKTEQDVGQSASDNKKKIDKPTAKRQPVHKPKKPSIKR